MSIIANASREAQVPAQVQTQNMMVNELAGAVELLEGRLLSVLSEQPSTKGEGVATPEPLLSPLADAIRGNTSLVERTLVRLRSLLDRLEL